MSCRSPQIQMPHFLLWHPCVCDWFKCDTSILAAHQTGKSSHLLNIYWSGKLVQGLNLWPQSVCLCICQTYQLHTGRLKTNRQSVQVQELEFDLLMKQSHYPSYSLQFRFQANSKLLVDLYLSILNEWKQATTFITHSLLAFESMTKR